MSPNSAFLPLIAPLKFYAVMPDAAWVVRMIRAGVNTVQLRVKNQTHQTVIEDIKTCVAAAKNSKTQFFVNDYWEDAIRLGAYGVHLGQEDLVNADIPAILKAGLRLGISTHSVDELDDALAFGPSYVASGAIFPTRTKEMPTAPQGLDRLKHYVIQAKGTPVVAIGGINLENAKAVLSTGVSSLAVVSALTAAKHPEETVKDFQALWLGA